jgi:hypothetical protein
MRGDARPRDPFQKVDEVPTAQKVDGVWGVGAMPTSEVVTRYANLLTTLSSQPIAFGPYSTLCDDDKAASLLREFNTWWAGYHDGDAPLGDWAEPLSRPEQVLLDRACEMLCSWDVSELAAGLKSSIYPEDWNSSSGGFRFTFDRLLDRVRLNVVTHATLQGGELPANVRFPLRMAGWVGHDGAGHPPQTTLFARRHARNAFHDLLGRLASTSTPLGSVVGLPDQPDSFALPLDWEEAVRSGLDPGSVARLPADLRARLASFGDDVKAGVRAAGGASYWATLIGILAFPIAPVGSIAAILLAGVPQALADAIDHWPAALDRASDHDAFLHDAGYELLHMLRQTRYDGVFDKKVSSALGLDDGVLFLNLSPGQVQDIERALRPPPDFPPMVLLGDLFATYARHFGEKPFLVGRAPRTDVVSDQLVANGLWTTWWNSAGPTIDLAYLLDTAGLVLEQVVHLDDALLALGQLAAGEGMLAVALRGALGDQGLGALTEGLGGASPSAILRFCYRQLWTDHFVAWLTTYQDVHGTDGTDLVRTADLYLVFAWMGTKAKRGQIDAALGPMLEVTADNAGPLWTAYRAFALRWGYGTRPISMRGWMLPGAADADRGAFGRVVGAVVDSGVQGITLGDVGLIRDWLIGARTSRIDNLRAQLEPDWDSTVDAPDVPDVLPTRGLAHQR